MPTSMVQDVLPNPDLYLNHLPPAYAADFETTRCVTIIVLGATLLDILVYIPDDLWILSHSRFDSIIICFVLSRLLAASYVLNCVVQMTTALDNFSAPTYASGVLCVLAIGCSSYLFLRRVHAIYADNRRVRWFFSVLWFISRGSDLAIPLGVVPGYIPGTHYYLAASERPIVSFSVIAGVVFDTSVFSAITYKIASQHSLVDEQVSWSTIVSGKALPRLSRAVLKGGQQYYLITVGMNTLAVFTLLLPLVHPILKGMFVIPLIPLTASMVSRVFRNLKLLSLNDSDITFIPLQVV